MRNTFDSSGINDRKSASGEGKRYFWYITVDGT